MKQCWRCDKEVPGGQEHCPHCGAGISETAVNLMASIDGSVPEVQIVSGVLVKERYEVREKLGEGGMGVVYRAWDRTIEREVAIKVIPQQLCLDPRAVEKLKKETTIALDLTQENIVRLHTLDTWEGQAFVVMEYVGGGTLAHFLYEHGNRSLEESIELLGQIAAAIDYAHNASPAVIHRDLKPLNILLTENGRIKVADFGLARVLRDSASRVSGHETVGTLAYMAPEQLRGKGVGRKADIYALAAIAYELLAGRPPFHTGDLRWQIMHEDPEPIAGQDERTNEVLLRALAKNPDERPESAGQLVRQLQGEESLAAPAKPKKKKQQPQRTTSSRSRSSIIPKVMLGGAGLVLLAALAVAGFYYQQDLTAVFRGGPILTITSEPPGAMAYIDGGRVHETPVQISELSTGTHQVRLTKERYEEYEENVFIQQDQPVSLTAKLTPEPYGDLEVTSSPAGARVMVDGKEQGVTPTLIERLPAGERTVLLEKAGYDPREQRIEIVPLQTSTVSAELVSIHGSLSVTSEPSGATVFIDGEQVGTTPYSSSEVLKGQRQIKLEYDDHDTWETAKLINTDQNTEVAAELISSFGAMTVDSDPSGAEVYIDGTRAGTTPYKSDRIAKGTRVVTLKKERYRIWEREVAVTIDAPAAITAQLKEALGILEVMSAPPGAEIIIDGKTVGTAPLKREMLAGQYSVQAQLGGGLGSSKKVQLTVAASEQSRVELQLSWKKTVTDPTTGMELLYVKGGCYQMGDTFGDGDSDEKPLHEVCVDDFYMGTYEVTQGEYQTVTGSNPSRFKKGSNYPVEEVSWNEAQEFISELNSRSNRSYRLPTEAEWEYAAREGGKEVRFGTGKNTIGPDEANFDGRSKYKKSYSRSGVYRETTTEVGSFSPNSLGLYDMSGNVREWCRDWYDSDYYESSPRSNPQGPSSAANRVIRGGSWGNYPGRLRAAYRLRGGPVIRSHSLGFRLVLPAQR